MSVTIEAIYENGALRPLKPLTLNEGEKVFVTVGTEEGSVPRDHEPRQIAQMLAEIAEHSVRYGRVETGSIDHDKILCCAPKARARLR